MCSNDNDSQLEAPLTDPLDGYGRAAFLLVDSLIHGLCENNTLDIGKAVAIAERAVDVQQDYVEAADDTERREQRALALLQSIKASLQSDENGMPENLD